MRMAQWFLRCIKTPLCVGAGMALILVAMAGYAVYKYYHGYEPVSLGSFYRLPVCQKGILRAMVNKSGRRANYNVLDAANRICTAVATDRALLQKQQKSGGSPYLIHAYQEAILKATSTRIVGRMRLSTYYHGEHKYASLAERPRQRFAHVFGMFLPSHIQHQYREHIRYMKINETVAAEQ